MATLVLATRYRAAFLARVYAAFAVIRRLWGEVVAGNRPRRSEA